jgi:hypothetical protein
MYVCVCGGGGGHSRTGQEEVVLSLLSGSNDRSILFLLQDAQMPTLSLAAAFICQVRHGTAPWVTWHGMCDDRGQQMYAGTYADQVAGRVWRPYLDKCDVIGANSNCQDSHPQQQCDVAQHGPRPVNTQDKFIGSKEAIDVDQWSICSCCTCV